MGPPAGKGIEEGRQDGHQRLALAGRQFGEAAAVHDRPRDQLHVKGPESQGARKR